MTKVALRVENLSKCFRIGRREPYYTLRDVMARALRSPLHRLRGRAPENGANEAAHVWALQDVSFEVREGEVVGIIGRNGAGKSTLLRILSRVTKPTKGCARIYGRVRSLLEVGTGFHHELTGRENIYMNGAILGMKSAEIRRKFDEIVAFAEVERFVDTPVKHYSTGMYMRLAFAVAAHLEPEILVVDEVLAVGDAQFQKKCLGKMEGVSRSGCTVLFVSHNMGSVLSLCPRGILLSEGHLVLDSDATAVCREYVNAGEKGGERRVTFPAKDNARLSFLEVAIVGPDDSTEGRLQITDEIRVLIRYRIATPTSGAVVGIRVRRDGILLFNSFDTDEHPERLGLRLAGTFEAVLRLPQFLLGAGRYTVSLVAGIPLTEELDDRPDALSFDLEEETQDLWFKSYARTRGGLLIVPIEWMVQRIRDETAQRWN